jgi:hypothetical protein
VSDKDPQVDRGLERIIARSLEQDKARRREAERLLRSLRKRPPEEDTPEPEGDA